LRSVDFGPLPLGRRPSGRSHVSCVFRWRQAYRRKGPRRLAPKPTPGRPPRLARAENCQLVKLLTRGARYAGYRTDLWTLPRVTELIHQEFGVRYPPAHVWKVLTALGWSCQKPERRAVERDEAAIARWKREEWPWIKKRRATWRPSRIHR
jgi:transposase